MEVARPLNVCHQIDLRILVDFVSERLWRSKISEESKATFSVQTISNSNFKVDDVEVAFALAKCTYYNYLQTYFQIKAKAEKKTGEEDGG